MWNKVEDKLPDDDREVLCVVRNYKEPHWLKKEMGVYINGKWYIRNGYTSNHEEIIKWCEIPEDDDLRTSEEWLEIYTNVNIAVFEGWDESNFQYSWFEELITEETFTRRLLHSTQFPNKKGRRKKKISAKKLKKILGKSITNDLYE